MSPEICEGSEGNGDKYIDLQSSNPLCATAEAELAEVYNFRIYSCLEVFLGRLRMCCVFNRHILQACIRTLPKRQIKTMHFHMTVFLLSGTLNVG